MVSVTFEFIDGTKLEFKRAEFTSGESEIDRGSDAHTYIKEQWPIIFINGRGVNLSQVKFYQITDGPRVSV